jgi:ABC-type transport system involved in cytochrome bd biosynthesis fused ATPase/permease subunit
MNDYVKQYELALKACKIMLPLGVAFFEVLGIILWVTLADAGYGLPIGLPIMLLGLLFGVIFFFAIRYMKNKLTKLQNENNKGR